MPGIVYLWLGHLTPAPTTKEVQVTIYRYPRWDGSQQVFGPDGDGVMDSLSDGITDHGDTNCVLRACSSAGCVTPRVGVLKACATSWSASVGSGN